MKSKLAARASSALLILLIHAGLAESASVGVTIGGVRPKDVGTSPSYGVFFQPRAHEVELMVDAGFLTKSDKAYGLQSSFSDIHVGISAVKGLRLLRDVLLGRASAGIAAHEEKTSGGIIGREQASDARIRLGLRAALGLDVRLTSKTWMIGMIRLERILGDRDHSAETRPAFLAGLRFVI